MTSLVVALVGVLAAFGDKEGVRKHIKDESANFLDGCAHVYLDVGSNIGVQIRKLYEPYLYPNATVHKVFNEYFGKDRSHVCAVGFEPNPNHEKRLRAVEQCYLGMGRNVRFFYAAAASTDGQSSFMLDGLKGLEEWASSLYSKAVKTATKKRETVATLDFAAFVNSVVAGRKIPRNAKSSVVAKLDIEGAELTVLPHMTQTGALCAWRSKAVHRFPFGINYTMIEFHPWSFPEQSDARKNMWVLQAHLPTLLAMDPDNCAPTVISQLDDETYLHDGMPFPNRCS